MMEKQMNPELLTEVSGGEHPPVVKLKGKAKILYTICSSDHKAHDWVRIDDTMSRCTKCGLYIKL